ncbi:Protein phosphatase 2C (PP2C)-like domain [Moorella glycerini]|uniref:Stage II sporulation protein E n=1 Tax=Neomoorella stamsii TaxID=1266720 RepID=A0A9X7P4V1_9FIRM|nr:MULTISPECIES: SpoIIE family protein phosphatase [Moorella]PRR69557.1 Stage II sporulation protein E [Moorella stamsii]CEP68789.1 Protein phosphatase 2C (PP2C)-like domain [Moorella glycerini]
MKLQVEKPETDQQAREGSGWEVAAYSRPHWREKVNGDLCYAKELDAHVLVVVADVLGHGEGAHHGAVVLARALQRAAGVLQQAYAVLEEAALQTRGCALFLALLDRKTIEYILVGNVRGWVLTRKGTEVLVGQPGIVGKRMFNPVIRRLELSEPALLLACTDGIKRSFSPVGLSWLWEGTEEATARRVVERYGIAEDDASVLVGRRHI